MLHISQLPLQHIIYFAHFFVIVTGGNNNDVVNSSSVGHTYNVISICNSMGSSEIWDKYHKYCIGNGENFTGR